MVFLQNCICVHGRHRSWWSEPRYFIPKDKTYHPFVRKYPNMKVTYPYLDGPFFVYMLLLLNSKQVQSLPETAITLFTYAHKRYKRYRTHDDVIKWKHFPRYWPFVRGIHRSPVNSPHKGQWRGALMLSLICAWINDWVNNREASDLRRHRAHYDATVMYAVMIILDFQMTCRDGERMLWLVASCILTACHRHQSPGNWQVKSKAINSYRNHSPEN